MTQQYVSESLAFQSDAMPHGHPDVVNGADERWLDQDIHARIQDAWPKAQAPVSKQKITKRRR